MSPRSIASFDRSPAGATSSRQPNDVAPAGLRVVNWARFQGLAPLATRLGPFGAIRAPLARVSAHDSIMADEILLNEAAYAVWQTVKERGPIELGEVVKLTGVDQAQVSAAATEAAKQRVLRDRRTRARRDCIQRECAGTWSKPGLPEHLAVEALVADLAARCRWPKFVEWAKSANVAVNEVLKWGAARGWIRKRKTTARSYRSN